MCMEGPVHKGLRTRQQSDLAMSHSRCAMYLQEEVYLTGKGPMKEADGTYNFVSYGAARPEAEPQQVEVRDGDPSTVLPTASPAVSQVLFQAAADDLQTCRSTNETKVLHCKYAGKLWVCAVLADTERCSCEILAVMLLHASA